MEENDEVTKVVQLLMGLVRWSLKESMDPEAFASALTIEEREEMPKIIHAMCMWLNSVGLMMQPEWETL